MSRKIQGCNRVLALLLLALTPALTYGAQPAQPAQPVKTALPPQPALLRFKFGPEKSPECPGFIEVTTQIKFTPELGYGWLEKGGDARNQQGPDALFRSWIESRETFAVALPNGAYFAWFVVGDNNSYPCNYTVTQSALQGKTETLLTKKIGFQEWWDWYFSLQDIEWDEVQSIWDTYVEHKFKTYTVPVVATGGRMQLNFDAAPVCCLAIYPRSLQESAEGVLAGVRRTQRAAFDKKYKLELPSPKIAQELITPAAQQAGFILLAVNPLVEEGTEDVYQQEEETYLSYSGTPGVANTKAIESFGALGQCQPLALTILPLRDVPSAKVTVGDLKSGDSVLPASAVEVGCQRYAIQPNSADGIGSHLAPRDIVRGDAVRLHDHVPQRVWLTVKVPADAKAGSYEGTITVTAGESAAAMPLRFKVLPFQLDPAANVARGPFYYFPSGPFDTFRMELGDKYWSLVEGDFKFMAEHGMNSVPEMPNLYGVLTQLTDAKGAPIDDWKPNPKWPQDMDRFVALYRKYNFAGPIAPYGMINLARWSGFPAIDKPNDPIPDRARKFITAFMTALKTGEKERGWPEIVFYVSDELSNDGDAGGQWGVRYLKFLDEIKKAVPGGFRTCSSMDGDAELVMVPYLDFVMPNGGEGFITDKWAESIRAAGHQLWLYNGYGFDRFSFGYFLWRLGGTGRYVWHFDARTYSPTCNPYNAFDERIGLKYVYGYPTRDGTRRATADSERNRAGIDDLRCLVTLEKAIAANPGKPESKAAGEWLNWLRAHVAANPGYYGEWGEWDPSVYDKLRWQAAQQILKVLGKPVP